MDEGARVSVDLPEELTDELRAAVEAGEHASLNEAVAAAVESWTADRIVARIGIDALRRHLESSIAAGDPRPLDPDEIERQVRVRVAELRRERLRAG